LLFVVVGANPLLQQKLADHRPSDRVLKYAAGESSFVITKCQQQDFLMQSQIIDHSDSPELG
jgi:hypothetical protein